MLTTWSLSKHAQRSDDSRGKVPYDIRVLNSSTDAIIRIINEGHEIHDNEPMICARSQPHEVIDRARTTRDLQRPETI
jgi:hypothetical protein